MVLVERQEPFFVFILRKINKAKMKSMGIKNDFISDLSPKFVFFQLSLQ